MDAFTDYIYYSETFHGKKIPENDFDRLALEATVYLNAVTHGRATADSDSVKMASCAVAEAMQRSEAVQSGEALSSENTDGRSVSYVQSENDSASQKKKWLDAASLYLYGTGLLYQGLC
jgi:hypothetical protein